MYALLSVSDKSGIQDFASALIKLGYQILSTGGTLKHLQQGAVSAIDIAQYTGSPELFDGRIKTLHPRIHGGILYQRDSQNHCLQAKEHEILPIDLICVNLYPFKAATMRTQDLDEIIENIDIGGPSMIRAGAKNFKNVLVVTDICDYQEVIAALQNNQNTLEFRRKMMIKAYSHTAAYDSMIANYMNSRFCDGFGEDLFIHARKVFPTRYGENPHQKGAFYEFASHYKEHLQIHKGEPSFNNLTDLNAAISIIKHANPCGFAIKQNVLESYTHAMMCDPLSAYGGVVAVNGVIDKALALKINETFIEVLVGAKITQEALAVFKDKKRIKIFSLGRGESLFLPRDVFDFKRIEGGLLYQNNDKILSSEVKDSKIVSAKSPTQEQLQDLQIAHTIAALTKSNCVSYVKNGALVAIGMGMTSRVDASRAAIAKAKEMKIDLQGCVLASEAFFPFKDSIEMAAQIGVSAIIEPGGSIRDDEIIACANQNQIALLFSGVRHFLH